MYFKKELHLENEHRAKVKVESLSLKYWGGGTWPSTAFHASGHNVFAVPSPPAQDGARGGPCYPGSVNSPYNFWSRLSPPPSTDSYSIPVCLPAAGVSMEGGGGGC